MLNFGYALSKNLLRFETISYLINPSGIQAEKAFLLVQEKIKHCRTSFV